MSLFDAKVAVVTGASSGIGRAVALGLASHGATVFAVGRRPEALAALVEQTGSKGKILGYQADLEVDQDIQGLARHLDQASKRVDILVHSAGKTVLGRLETAPVTAFDQQYRINVRAPYLLTQALLPMLRAQQGNIVFINSSAGLRNARAGCGQYAATKNALKAIADSLREETNAEEIRVLSIYPGRTASPMQAAVRAMEGKIYQPERLMQPEDVAEVVINALSLSRNAEITDISVRPFQIQDD